MNQEALAVVLGNRHYAVERPWGRLPEGERWGPISQLAVDSGGHVYVFQRADPPVLVLDAEGEYLRGWGAEHVADAHGICVTGDDRVLLVDRDAHQVLAFTTEGELLWSLGERHRPRHRGAFNHPTDVAVADDGEIYVADGYGNSRVHRFSARGELLQSWGEPGRGPGEFSTPHGIWVDRRDRVLVADRENDRVQVFDRDGRYLDEWGDLDHPMDLYEDEQGRVYVTDCIPRLNVFDAEGRLIGRCRPTWNAAHGVWGNRRGDLFLAEQTPSRVTRLRFTGEDA